MKIFVTGADGYIGRNLITALKSKGYEIRMFVEKITDNNKHANPTIK